MKQTKHLTRFNYEKWNKTKEIKAKQPIQQNKNLMHLSETNQNRKINLDETWQNKKLNKTERNQNKQLNETKHDKTKN